MSYAELVMRDLFERIPALSALRGIQRLDAEEAITRAIDEVIDAYIADCERVENTGGAP